MHSLRSVFYRFGFQVKVGCCTVDVIKQLSGEMISRNPKDGSSRDRMTAIINHILSQGRHVVVIHLVGVFSLDPSIYSFFFFLFTLFANSFYPLYPPAEGIPLDLSLAPEALEVSTIPDVLILPSDLASFVKVLLPPSQIKCI